MTEKKHSFESVAVGQLDANGRAVGEPIFFELHADAEQLQFLLLPKLVKERRGFIDLAAVGENLLVDMTATPCEHYLADTPNTFKSCGCDRG